MLDKFYAGKRISFWYDGRWQHGRLAFGAAKLTPQGLFFGIITDSNTYIADIPVADIKEEDSDEK